MNNEIALIVLAGTLAILGTVVTVWQSVTNARSSTQKEAEIQKKNSELLQKQDLIIALQNELQLKTEEYIGYTKGTNSYPYGWISSIFEDKILFRVENKTTNPLYDLKYQIIDIDKIRGSSGKEWFDLMTKSDIFDVGTLEHNMQHTKDFDITINNGSTERNLKVIYYTRNSVFHQWIKYRKKDDGGFFFATKIEKLGTSNTEVFVKIDDGFLNSPNEVIDWLNPIDGI